MGVCAAHVHANIKGIFNVTKPDISRAILDCGGEQVAPRILLRRFGTPAME